MFLSVSKIFCVNKKKINSLITVFEEALGNSFWALMMKIIKKMCQKF